MDPVGALFWMILIGGVMSRGPAMIYIFFAMQSFGTVAMIPPALLGGVTFTPEWIATVALATKVIFLQPNPSLALPPLLDPNRLGLLTLATAYAVFSAIFLPLLFRGVLVVPMRMANTAYPLSPSPANFTQTFYFILTTLATLTFYKLVANPGLKRHVLNGILFGGAVAIMTGVIDMIVPASLLTPFRTASYAILAGGEMNEGKRVAGLMSEASAYASVCMGFAGALFFLRGTFSNKKVRTIVVPVVFLLLIVMIGLSTSSGGYVGLAVLLVMVMLYSVNQISKGNMDGVWSLYFVAVGAFLIGLVAAFHPDSFDKPIDMVNRMVFQKHLSSSYVERSFWNQVGLADVRSTFGLGVGLGSTRASSWVVAVLANIGVIGAGFMLAFLARAFLSRPPIPTSVNARTASGAKFALIPLLTIEALSGTSVGFGLMAACLCGLIVALSRGAQTADAPTQTPVRRGRPRPRRLVRPTPALTPPPQSSI